MYEIKIFNNLDELWLFLIKHNITDYSFNTYEFRLELKTKSINKTNYFLSYKL